MKDKGVMSLKVRTGQWLLWWEGLETQIKIHGGVPRIPHQVSFFTLLTYSSWWAGKWAFREIKSVLSWRQRKKKGNVTSGATCHTANFEDGGRCHESRNARDPALETGKGKETPPKDLHRGGDPADTWSSTHGD